MARRLTADEKASIARCDAILPPVDQVTIERAAALPEWSYNLAKLRRLY